jgi:hypothetical protein
VAAWLSHKPKPFNANDANETNNAKFYPFREIRPLCAIRVEIAPQNQQPVRLF